MYLKTLGTLQLQNSNFQRPKPLLLLTYLIVEGQKERKHLWEMFWPNAADPAKSFRVALAQLQKGLPNAIEINSSTIKAIISSDISDFLAALKEEHLQKVIDLYQGPFLDGFYLKGWSVELEEWVYYTREFLAKQVSEVLFKSGEEEAARGNFDKAAKLAERVYQLKEAGGNEPEILRKLHTLMLAGNSFQAGQVKEEALDFELSLVETAQEAKKLLQTTSQELQRAIPNNLPNRQTSFIGRNKELSDLAIMLKDPAHRLITLVGWGGIGKSRLALKVAKEHLNSEIFANGIYHVSLESITKTSNLPTIIATALQIALHEKEDPLTQLIQGIGTKTILLVLDNYEHLLDKAILASELISACPNIKILVTSRERLNLEEEWVYTLEGLPFPKGNQITFEEASYCDAAQLFTQRAKHVFPSFNLTVQDFPYLLNICQQVASNPLALELAAVWVNHMPLNEIAQEICRDLDFLTITTRNISKRHQSLRGVFEYSWKMLSAKEQTALKKLAVFCNGFTREAAGEVANVSIPVLLSLVNKSLLKSNAKGRYNQHPLLRYYAQEKLATSPEELLVIKHSHCNYFFAYLSKYDSEIWGSQSSESLIAIDLELENIKMAWGTASATKNHLLLEQPDCLVIYFDRRAYYEDGLTLFNRAISSLSEVSISHHHALSKVMIDKAWLLYRTGDFEDATTVAKQALTLIRPLSQDERKVSLTLMKALNTLGTLVKSIGDYKQAKVYSEEALLLAKTTKELSRVAYYLTNLATIEVKLGNYFQAENCYWEARAAHKNLGDSFGLAINLLNLSDLLIFNLERPQEAEQLLQEGMEIAKEVNFQSIIPYFLVNSSFIAYYNFNYPKAQELCLEALNMSKHIGDRGIEANALTLLGLIESNLKHHQQANEHFRKSLEIAWSTQEMPRVLLNLIYISELQTHIGNFDTAYHWLNIALTHPAINEWEWGRKEGTKALNTLQTHHSFDKVANSNNHLSNSTTNLELIVNKLITQPTRKPAQNPKTLSKG